MQFGDPLHVDKPADRFSNAVTSGQQSVISQDDCTILRERFGDSPPRRQTLHLNLFIIPKRVIFEKNTGF